MHKGIHIPGEGDITELVLDEFRRGRMREAVAGAYQARRIAAMFPTQRTTRMGRPVANIPVHVYNHWVHREGAECWADAGFRKDLLRDNEELRPRVAKNMSTVSFAGCRGIGPDKGLFAGSGPTNKRFSKTYGEHASKN